MDWRRRVAGAVVLTAAFLLCWTPAAAQVTGGCTAQARASISAPIDITSATVWHVHRDDVVSGGALAPSAQGHATVDIVFFGVSPPFAHLIQSSGGGGLTGAGGPYHVSDFARYGRVFAVSGSSDRCSGSLVVVIDDVSAAGTLVGGAGLAVGIAGLLGVLGMLRARGRFLGRGVGAVMGLLSGTGFGLFLQQALWVDPTSLRTLALPLAGLVAGLLLAGALAPSPPPAPAWRMGQPAPPPTPSAPPR